MNRGVVVDRSRTPLLEGQLDAKPLRCIACYSSNEKSDVVEFGHIRRQTLTYRTAQSVDARGLLPVVSKLVRAMSSDLNPKMEVVHFGSPCQLRNGRFLFLGLHGAASNCDARQFHVLLYRVLDNIVERRSVHVATLPSLAASPAVRDRRVAGGVLFFEDGFRGRHLASW